MKTKYKLLKRKKKIKLTYYSLWTLKALKNSKNILYNIP